MAPRAPKMKEGPSGLNLALGLAGAGFDAYGTYKAGQAPKGFIDPPNYDALKAPTGIGNNTPFGRCGVGNLGLIVQSGPQLIEDWIINGISIRSNKTSWFSSS